MSGGKFLLVISTGLQNQLLNAIELLNSRIKKHIMQKNKSYTEEEMLTLSADKLLSMDNSVLPGLNMVEQSHLVLTNGHFKPMVPTTMEYLKILPLSNGGFGKTVTFQPTQVGNFINDMVLHIKISGLRAADRKDRVRYVAFPGHKLIEKVQFLVNNGSIIDEFTTEDYNNHYKYGLNTTEKKKNWCKNVGQELPKLGYLTSDPAYDMQREYRWIGDGYQTLKYSQDSLEMFIPFLFWFKELKNALPSHIIPWGMMQIKVFLADITDIIGFADYGGGGKYIAPTLDVCELYVNNIFTTSEIYNLYVKKFTFSLIRVHKHHREIIKSVSNGDGIHLSQLKFPIENLFITFRPVENINMSQHWYKSSKIVEKTYKVPVVAINYSNIITGDVLTQPAANSAILVSGSLSANDNAYEGYDFVITAGSGFNETDLTKNRYSITAYNATEKKITIAGNFYGNLDSTSAFELFLPQLAMNTVSYYDEIPTVNTIALYSQNIKIWDSSPEMFYNAYLPSRFGGLMGMPEETGSYFVPFNFYPLAFQHTGSFNCSVAREFYLTISSDVISADYPVELNVSARSINFLYISEGGMKLKDPI